LLDDPGGIECRVTPQGGAAQPVTLADLRLQPIDALLMLRAAEATAGEDELDRRVAWQVAGPAGPDRPVTIDYESAEAPGAIPFAVAFELLAAAGGVLGFGRPLAPRDLLPPEQERRVGEADPMMEELEVRSSAAREALTGVRNDLAAAIAAVISAPEGSTPDLRPLRAALVAAAGLGVPAAFPSSRHAADEATRDGLIELAASVLAELDTRSAAADASPGPAEVLGAVFTRALPIVPRFRPAAPELLAPGLAAEPDLGAEPDATVEGWMAQLSRVRPPIDAWRDVRLFGQALGRTLDRPRIAQLPLQTEPALPRWAGLAFGDETNRPRSGLVSLALVGTGPPAATDPWSGLLLDAWPELIPSREEDAGVVFHFDAPRAEAPHAVLLAVPPSPAKTWSYDDLERTLLHTLELSRMRALDLSNFGAYAQLVPMTFLAANPANDAVSTSFAGLLIADAVMAREGG
jgi:hypothetical protein